VTLPPAPAAAAPAVWLAILLTVAAIPLVTFVTEFMSIEVGCSLTVELIVAAAAGAVLLRCCFLFGCCILPFLSLAAGFLLLLACSHQMLCLHTLL
jgi:hypothetical protein